MNNELLNIINQKQLVSVMNSTKWRKLIDGLSNINDFNPEISQKYISDDEPSGFGLVWWELVYRDCSYIEWIDISPIKREFVGLLVSDKLTDCTANVLDVLKEKNIPYSIEGMNFRVWGYIAPGENPNFE